jgi:exosome complex component RRP40
MVDDRVLAIVEDRVGPDGAGGDLYRMNLVNASHPAVLSNLEFEGATKRNKPSLSTGMLLYTRVVATGGVAMDPTLSCQLGPRDVGLPRKDWMTNEGTYGELKSGTVCRISLGLARELLHPDNLVLQELSNRRLAFEVCVGVNGLLWIHSSRPETTIMIQNAILNSEVLTEEQVRGMVKKLVDTAQKQLQRDD